jgi:hypothetical protein
MRPLGVFRRKPRKIEDRKTGNPAYLVHGTLPQTCHNTLPDIVIKINMRIYVRICLANGNCAAAAASSTGAAPHVILQDE